MTPRDRVRAALAHAEPDFTPCDYFATPEIHQGLLEHFGIARDGDTSGAMGLSADDAIRERLGTDVRYVEPPRYR